MSKDNRRRGKVTTCVSRHQCTREPPLRPINARTTKCSILIRTRLNGGARPDWNVNPPMETKYDNREKKKTNASVWRVANVGSCPLSVTRHTHKKKSFIHNYAQQALRSVAGPG